MLTTDVLCSAACKACGARLDREPCAAPAAPGHKVFAGSVPSYAEAHRHLSAFAAAWRAAGRPPLTALSFDVTKAFDNVDVDKVKKLLETSVITGDDGWEVHAAKETVRARGRAIIKCAPRCCCL